MSKPAPRQRAIGNSGTVRVDYRRLSERLTRRPTRANVPVLWRKDAAGLPGVPPIVANYDVRS